MVIYAWAVAQDYFKEMTDQSVREEMYEEDKLGMDEDMAPFGFLDDGLGDTVEVDANGDVWHADEYGERAYMWEYLS